MDYQTAKQYINSVRWYGGSYDPCRSGLHNDVILAHQKNFPNLSRDFPISLRCAEEPLWYAGIVLTEPFTFNWNSPQIITVTTEQEFLNEITRLATDKGLFDTAANYFTSEKSEIAFEANRLATETLLKPTTGEISDLQNQQAALNQEITLFNQKIASLASAVSSGVSTITQTTKEAAKSIISIPFLFIAGAIILILVFATRRR